MTELQTIYTALNVSVQQRFFQLGMLNSIIQKDHVKELHKVLKSLEHLPQAAINKLYLQAYAAGSLECVNYLEYFYHEIDAVYF